MSDKEFGEKKPDNIGDIIKNTSELEAKLEKIRQMPISGEKVKAYFDLMDENLEKRGTELKETLRRLKSRLPVDR